MVKLQEENSVQNIKHDDIITDIPVIRGKEEKSGQGGDQLVGEFEEKEGKEEQASTLELRTSSPLMNT